jgi:hypothetical protein
MRGQRMRGQRYPAFQQGLPGLRPHLPFRRVDAVFLLERFDARLGLGTELSRFLEGAGGCFVMRFGEVVKDVLDAGCRLRRRVRVFFRWGRSRLTWSVLSVMMPSPW